MDALAALSNRLRHRRALAYLIVGLALAGSGVALRGFEWQGGASLHTLMEALATLLALYVGSLALIRYFSQMDRQFLYIGAGFVGTGLLDGYHGLVTSTFFQPFMPSEYATLVPWSWLASRIYLSVLMVLSWLLLAGPQEEKQHKPDHVQVFVVMATTTFATFLFFAFAPLPVFYHRDALFPRPFDLLPGVLFLVALAGYLWKGKWRTDSFEHWLVLSLIVGVALQFSFISFSGRLYDLEFDVAHLLKKASYILVLVGLLVNLRETYAGIQEESARRQLAEEEALRGRDRLYSILEGLPGFVYLQAPDYSIRYANRYFREHFGDPDGVPCYRRLFGRAAPCEPCPTFRVFDSGEPVVWEGRARDGRTYQIFVYPFADESGSPLALELGIDISERKEAEEKLRDASLYGRSLIEASLDPLVTIGADGSIMDVNAATEKATGLPRERLIGSDFAAYFTDPELALQIYRQVFAQGQVTDYPLTLRHAAGHVCEVLYNASVYRNAEGQVAGVFAAARDVTERKRMEEDLRRSNADLEQFAYAISHDMRQPLRMVTSYLQLIEKALRDRLDDDTRQFMGFAKDGARRMEGMIQGLLEFSRVGRKSEPPGPLELRPALDEALAFLGPEISATGGAVEVGGDWPTLCASRDEMVRLFQNLVGNALKYHVPGQPPRVDVRGEVLPGGWRCEIRDYGIGIDPAQIERLFKVFSRLQAHSRYEGAGVGLALCRKIVEHHGGRIGITSAGEGQGSTSWFELPLCAAQETEKPRS